MADRKLSGSSLGVQWRALLVACVLPLGIISVEAQNILVNPGFESASDFTTDPITAANVNQGWALFANGADSYRPEYQTNNPVHSGSYSVLIGNAPGNAWNPAGAFQIVTNINPGDAWTASIWAITDTGLLGAGTAGTGPVDFQVQFRDASLNLIGSAIETGWSAVTNTWQQYNLSGTAPAGTAYVAVYAMSMVDGNNSGQVNVYFDDASFNVIPPSGLAASILSPANSSTVGTNFTINAAASVSPGTVTNVYFYDGASLLGNVSTSPYNFDVTGAPFGTHALTVVAKDDTGGSVTSAVVNVTVVTDPFRFTVDPSKLTLGYMNYFELPQNGGGYAGGQSWAPADLCSSFSGSTLTLSPNTIGDSAAYWYVSTGNNSVGNKMMDASLYTETTGGLNGKDVTFAGTVLANTMVGSSITNAAGNGWTCVAFIKDFAPDYSSSVSVTTPLTNGTAFSITLPTINDPTRHVQYGFETIGPDVWPTDTALPSYGKVVIAPFPYMTIKPTMSGTTLNLSFPSVTGYNYVVQYKTNLTDVGWQILSTLPGTGATITHTVSTDIGVQRFYRVIAL